MADYAPEQRRLDASLLIRDELGRVLLVKPSDRRTWRLVGGTVRHDEAPHVAARRHGIEQTQQALAPTEVLITDHLHANPLTGEPDAVVLVFDGGTISSVAPIRLPFPHLEHPSLTAWRFVPVTELAQYCANFEYRRVTTALDAQLDPKHRGYRDEGLPVPVR